MLDKARAELLADSLDLDALFACPACLFELAWRIHQGEQLQWQTIGATASMTWYELAPSLESVLVEARMAGVPFAAEGLADLRERAFRGALARAVVFRLASRIADEIGRDSRSLS